MMNRREKTLASFTSKEIGRTADFYAKDEKRRIPSHLACWKRASVYLRSFVSRGMNLSTREAAWLCIMLIIAFHSLVLSLVESLRFVADSNAASTHLTPLTVSLPEMPVAASTRTPNYGGIQYHNYSDSHYEATIDRNDDEKYDREREAFLDSIDQEDVDPMFFHRDELTNPGKCVPPNWIWDSFPSCNTFHEYGIIHEISETYNIRYLGGKGNWRKAILFESKSRSDILDDNDNSFVFKQTRLRKMGIVAIHQVHRESLILEKLSTSPRMTDIYGYCGSSMFVETMKMDTNDVIVPSEGNIKQSELDKLQTRDVHPMNNLTAQEKLDWALTMSEAVADLHGFPGGVIVNGDIHPEQYMINSKGEIKLNDHNLDVIMEYDPENKEYCKFPSKSPWYFNAPEKFNGTPVDERADVFQLGLTIYSLLTGLWPYYSAERKRRELIVEGYKPFLDPRYRTRSFIEGRLAEIMDKALEYDASDRSSVFEMITFLRETKRLAATKH